MSTTSTCHLLLVCSANLCRSVTAAEIALRALSNAQPPLGAWTIDSAGTDVAPGQRLPTAVEQAMIDLDIPLRTRPKPLTEPSVRRADIVLTAERRHRAIVVQRFPFAVQYTFTMQQFARLVAAGREAQPDHAAHACTDLLELARIGRATMQPVDDERIDISDPVQSGSRRAMLECASVLTDVMETIFLQ